MNNIGILIISIIVLIIIFLVVLIIISKNKINESLNTLLIANDDINNSLKQKYAIYKEMIQYIKDNISINDDTFNDFESFNRRECTKSDLINILDETTHELNKYVEKYTELLKNKDFLNLKRKLYHVELNLEAVVEYYNNKLVIYNDLKNHLPTSIATKIFEFENFNETIINKNEISSLINLN
ncbi:MAG: LemA family protein [Bacilli bacterium]|nr:LemA family protein [Bacilli bacterium]